ncbi:MAG TPA: hypothetical protein VGG15_01520 [Terriglobales bacterium]|jgi:hypothetical protein
MKLWLRITIFATGAGILFFGWHKAHALVPDLAIPKNNLTSSSELLVMIGGFVMLMAFAPSPQMLTRWTEIKKPTKARPAQFRRRRQRG